MSSLLAPPSATQGDTPEPRGCQTPRILSTPLYRRIETGRFTGLEDREALAYTSPAGQDAIELAESYGLYLDQWQQLALHHSLTQDLYGRWVCFECVLNIPRQNGKGGYLEARQLAGALLFGEKLIIHTAHQFKTAQESFLRLDRIISGSYSLSRRVRRYSRSHGEEGFEFFNGSRIRFLARSGSSGRGFSGDLLLFDEAMALRSAPMGALLPTLSAMPNPQVVYTGSAGIGAESEQLASLRARALAEGDVSDPSLAYLEWSIDQHLKECPRDERGALTCDNHDDRDSLMSLARANPALGIRMRAAHIAEHEKRTMRPDLYDRERLGVGDYPAVTEDTWQVISKEAWEALADPRSRATGEIAFCVDATPERSYACISVAGRNGERIHVEVIDHRPDVGWVPERAEQLNEKWKPRVWIVDAGGPAGSLIPKLKDRGLTVVSPTAREYAQSCGDFYDTVAAARLGHLDQAPLTAALAGAQKRNLGDAWAWARKGLSVDITPLVSATGAVWGLDVEVEEEEEPMENIW